MQKTRSLRKTDQKEEEEPFSKMPLPKDLKKLLKKYESLNEQSFSEFIEYYNSQVFKHNIEHFEVFLQACAKVFVLKKTPEGEYRILLKRQVLKDVLTDPQFNYGLPMKLPLKPPAKVEMPKFQVDLFT